MVYVFLNFSSQALVFVALLVDCIGPCTHRLQYDVWNVSDTFHEVKGKRERKKEVGFLIVIITIYVVLCGLWLIHYYLVLPVSEFSAKDRRKGQEWSEELRFKLYW